MIQLSRCGVASSKGDIMIHDIFQDRKIIIMCAINTINKVYFITYSISALNIELFLLVHIVQTLFK